MKDSSRFPITKALGVYVENPCPFPEQALDTARDGIIDALSLIIRAQREPMMAALCAMSSSTSVDSSLLLACQRSDPITAATINGAAAHAFALDDIAWSSHVSAMLLPALLAVGESLDASGAAILRAWVVGYEVLGELRTREPGSLHGTGWMPSGLLGPVAVAAAVANLRGFDANTASGAMAAAASFTGGVTANLGTPIKALHTGRAAAAGVFACDLAQRGLMGNSDVLERSGGLLQTISPTGRIDLASPVRLQENHPRILDAGLSFKQYPLCYSLHRLTDAAIDIGSGQNFDHAEIEHVEVSLGTRQLKMAPVKHPATDMQARYSAPFAVASGLIARAAGFAQLNPSFFESAPVRRLIDRTELIERDEASQEDPVFAPSDRLRVRLRNGQWLDSGEVTHARGHAVKPLTTAERRLKFLDNVSDGPIADPDSLFQRLQDLSKVSSVRQLAGWFSG